MSLPPPPPLDPARDALLLDFDGTLVELVDRPDAVVLDDRLAALLMRLAGTFAGRIALVSGRSVTQLDGFLAGRVPDLALVGSHGAELRVGGRVIAPDRPAALVAAERAARAAFEGEGGIVIEVKTLGMAIHYRLAPERAAAARAVAECFAGQDDLMLQEGKMMVELRAGGHDKGSGIAALLTQPPFSGAVPIFAGDDVTDEAGFVAASAQGGAGVLVGAARATAARHRLVDVAAVHRWLEQAA